MMVDRFPEKQEVDIGGFKVQVCASTANGIEPFAWLMVRSGDVFAYPTITRETAGQLETLAQQCRDAFTWIDQQSAEAK